MFKNKQLSFRNTNLNNPFILSERSNAIQCYRCTVGPSNRFPNRTQQLCLKFSEDDEFIVDCPYSTMCMKKVYQYQLLDGKKVETVSRDCAHQKYTEQVCNSLDPV